MTYKKNKASSLVAYYKYGTTRPDFKGPAVGCRKWKLQGDIFFISPEYLRDCNDCNFNNCEIFEIKREKNNDQ